LRLRGLVLAMLMAAGAVAVSAAATVIPVVPQLRGEGIFLPNLDDDARRCHVDPADLDRPGIEADERLAACNDAADEEVNGAGDEADLTMIELVGAPTGESVRVNVTPAQYVRVFVRHDNGFRPILPGDGVLTAAEVRAGAQIAVEGRDIIRDPARWDGRVTLSVVLGERRLDKELRVAPLLLQHDLLKATKVFAGKPAPGLAPPPGSHPGEWGKFSAALNRATRAEGIETQYLAGTEAGWQDVWWQDVFEPAVASMPARHGVQTMRVMIRSANMWNLGVPTPRPLGRLLFRDLRGPDVAVVQELGDTAPADLWVDQRGATGNIEALPPYPGFPHGRIVYGSAPADSDRKPAAAFVGMLAGQGLQPPVVVDTSWLLVGHADETMHVVRADNARGWTLMVADPRLAERVLRQAEDAGAGAAKLFEDTNSSRKPSVGELLGDAKTLAGNETAARHIDAQLSIMLAATGLTPDELVRVPVLFEESKRARGFVALTPGIPNGISLTAESFAAPDPHGPRVDGRDLFRVATEEALARNRVRVHWVEDLFWAHFGGGEVHCVTNAWRDTTTLERWW
jgi:protein-arginine deiminase